VSATNITVWVAKEAGLFEKSGLDVSFSQVTGGTNAMAAILAGDVHFGHLGGPEAINATANGAGLMVVANISPVYPYKLYVPPDVKAAADLKGKKIDVGSFGTSVEVATRVGLKNLGLDADKDLTLVATGTHATGTAALLGGAVQGRMDNLPDALELESKGFHGLIDMAAVKTPAASTTVVGLRALPRETVQKYVDAIVQGAARARKDKAFTLGVMRKYFKSDEEAAMSATYDYFLGGVTPALPYPRPEQFADAMAFTGSKNEKAKTVGLSKLLEPGFVQNAADRGLDQS
jgi:NitT/TauT family transport system substrate-binding protein